MSQHTTFPRSLWLPTALVIAALAWRVAKLKFGVADVLPNFEPFMALAFAGSVIMPRLMPWWLWPTLLLGVDLAIHSPQLGEMWLVYACLACAALAGGWLRGRLSALGAVLGTVVCELGFYIVTSTQAWFMSPVYAKTLSGWVQALTTGDPAYTPQAWVFLLTSLLSNAGFAVLLVASYVVTGGRARSPIGSSARGVC
jgi:hypothetical protein